MTTNFKTTTSRATAESFPWKTTWATDHGLAPGDIQTTIHATYTLVTVSEDLSEAAALAAAVDLPGTGEVL